MRDKLIRIYRDIPSSILIVIGFSLTIFVTLVAAGFFGRLIMAENKSKNSDYNMYYFNINHSDRIKEGSDGYYYMYTDEMAEKVHFNDIYNILYKNKLNFCIQSLVHIGTSQEIQRLATFIYSYDNSMPFALKKGYADFDSEELSVVIGESIEEYTEKINGTEYLYIDGIYFKVTGVTVNNETGEYDSSIYLTGNKKNAVTAMAEEDFEIDLMLGATYEMTLYGRNESTLEDVKSTEEEYERDYPVEVEISEEKTEYTEKNLVNRLYSNMYKIFLPILFIFCINGCYNISYLWIKVRKYDIAIRYTYGYSRFQIYCHILKEMSFLLVNAMIFTLILKLLYVLIFDDISSIADNIVYQSGIVICSIFIVLLVTSVGAYRYSKKIIPAEVLKEL